MEEKQIGKYQNFNFNPLQLVPNNTVLQQLTRVPTWFQNRLVALQFGGSTEIVHVAGVKIKQVPAKHW